MSGWEIVLAAASAVVSAAGAIQQGQSSRRMAEYQAAVAENNAVAARQEAERAEREHREKTRRARSAGRARFASGGVLPEEGSPLLFDMDLLEGSEIDALNIRRRGASEAANFRSQAGMSRYQGRVAQQSSIYKAGTTLLDGGSRVAGLWAKKSAADAAKKAAAGTPMTQDVFDFLIETGAWHYQ